MDPTQFPPMPPIDPATGQPMMMPPGVMPPGAPPMPPPGPIPMAMHVMPDGTVMEGPPHDGAMPLDPSMMDPSMMDPSMMDPSMMDPDPVFGMPPHEGLQYVSDLDVLQLFIEQLKVTPPSRVKEMLGDLPLEELDLLWQAAEEDEELKALLLKGVPLPDDYMPQRPRWYVDPPKPDVDTILDLARADWDYYQPLRDRFSADVDVYFNRTSGVFKDDKDRPDVARFVSTAVPSEVNLMTAQLGSIRPSYQIPVRHPDLRTQTQRVEDYLYWIDDLAERRHSRRGHGVFWRDIAMSLLLYGRVVMRRVLDLDDPEDPWDEVVLDPATCCPIEGGKHGLLRVTRWYQDTVANVSRDYGVDPKKVMAPEGTALNGKPWEQLKAGSIVTIIEWWDEKWTCVLTSDGRMIKPISAHDFGEVPFVYQLSGLGLPNFMSDPMFALRSTPVDNVTRSQAREDVALKGVSHIHWLKKLNEQREAYFSKVADALLKSDNPPIWMGVDTFAKNRAPSKLGTRKGKVYPYEMGHEQPTIPNFAPMPPVIGPLLENIGLEWAMSAMPMASYGVNGAANTSGTAIEGLAESGRDKMTPHLQALEAFYGRRAEQTLRFWKDWGRLIDDELGRYGVVTLPVRRKLPTEADTFELTPDIIERVGTYVSCKMTSMRMQNLGAIGAAVNQWTNGNMMSRREAMELRGVRDPDLVFAEIDYESALFDQRSADLRRLAALLRATGEDISEWEINQILTTLWARNIIKQMDEGNKALKTPPEQQGNPPMPEPPGVQGGVSMGDYGAGPGSQGQAIGRPQNDFNPM